MLAGSTVINSYKRPTRNERLGKNTGKDKLAATQSRGLSHQLLGVQKLDGAIQQINHYPVDKFYQNLLSYPVDNIYKELSSHDDEGD